MGLNYGCKIGSLEINPPDQSGEMDRLVDEAELKDAAAMAERLNAKVGMLDSHVTMLKAMGVDVQIVLHAKEDDCPNSMEVGPADCRIKIYYRDLADLKVKLKDAQDAIAYAGELGLKAAPKLPKGA